MAGEKAKGGRKNRKHGRNKSYNLRRVADGREDRNRKQRWLRALRRGKNMDRQLALRLHAEYGTRFSSSPHTGIGPYRAVG